MYGLMCVCVCDIPQEERPSRKRCDSFGMLDGLEEEASSCSSESSGGSGASSAEDSEEEELGGGAGGGASSLTLIRTNGQVYTYPDGKAGMGESRPRPSFFFFSCCQGGWCCCRRCSV